MQKNLDGKPILLTENKTSLTIIRPRENYCSSTVIYSKTGTKKNFKKEVIIGHIDGTNSTNSRKSGILSK